VIEQCKHDIICLLHTKKVITGTLGWASSWTDLESSRPPWLVLPPGEATHGDLQGELHMSKLLKLTTTNI